MNTSPVTPVTPVPSELPALVTRVSDSEWHAFADGALVGQADAVHRPDGRLFVSIDAWQSTVFDQLAEAVVAGLPRPIHAVADAEDTELLAAWQRAGFATVRRETEYHLPTDPQLTGLGSAPLPPGVTILPVGAAEEAPLRELDRAIRPEIEAGLGWRSMPVEVLPRPAGVTVVDPSKYAVAVRDGVYVGMLRLAPVPRRPRIGLLAVRADHQRQGIARALLSETLGALHRAGTATAYAEVDETNAPAAALCEQLGARRAGRTFELALH
ncbi:N-acetyltransferase GCN5 [Kitasatospora sp. MMS16-BH015]|uniref:GNAT family N-acetyltransferase n=1 Tax=Kitasatospora sp. MMS16-BH015 TaxID=2018025 RepID=UPI000CA351DE|nr:GNAT family N-acetyltransferase [Kitasatospora sp. MMS16-BH015]AUG76451.1 N-acetyltransferase GCN5 [Kitasatospora sp. MMS16-BH015]